MVHEEVEMSTIGPPERAVMDMTCSVDLIWAFTTQTW